jgi:CHAT domain-containing protein/Tfp pilus assembly protein PilF
MKPRLSLVELSNVLALGIAVALLSPGPCALAQATQAQEKQQAEVEPLLKEILSVMESGGEEGLRAWMKANKGRVEADWIVRLAERGAKERDENRIKAALLLAAEKGDKSCQANVDMKAGDYHSDLSDNTAAMKFYDLALRLYVELGDLSGQGNAYKSEGNIYYRTGEQVKAQECYNRALPIFRAAGDRSGEAKTLYNIGLVYSDLREPQKALEYFGQALPIFRAVGDRAGEAATLFNFGLVYWALGEQAKALEYYQQALPIFRAMGDRAHEATTLNNIGLAYSNLGDKPKALEYYNQALPIERAVGDRAGEARTLNNIGSVYSTLGDQAKALDYNLQALLVRRAVGDRAGEARTLNNIGNVYSALGEEAKALEYYLQALPVLHAAGNRGVEAVTLDNIGAAYSGLGQKAKALEYYQQAMAIQRAVGDRAGESITLNEIGLFYSALGKKAKALEYFGQALPIERTLGNRSLEAITLDSIGAVYSDLGKKAKALEYFEQALPIFRAIGDRADEATTLRHLMALHNGLRHPRLAVFFGKRSVNLYQEMRAAIQTLEKGLQRSYLKAVEGTYRKLADILAGQGRLGEAQQVLGLLKEEEYFEFVRRDAAAAKQLQGRADLTPTEQAALGRYEEGADKVTTIGRRVEELRAMRSRNADQEAELARLKEDLAAASKAFQVVLRQVEDDLGGTQARGARDVVQELQATRGLGVDLRSLGGDIVVLSTVVAEKAVWVILTTPTTQVAGRTKIEAAELNRKVLAFREVLSDPRADPRTLARELYGILVGPVEKDLAGAAPKTIAWVLDGSLRYLPVSALFDGKRYLVERFAGVELTLASRSRVRLQPSATWRALGLGVTEAHEGFDALPGVADELRAVVREEGTNDTKGALPGRRLLDRDFTRKALEAGREAGYAVVHIASHFVFRPGNATDSFLLLGDGSHLTVEDIRSEGEPLFTGAELLTLSACETAMGGERGDGREVEGLGVEAQNQGAQAVLATLWPVEDESTAELMAGFYRQRQEQGLSKAEALREAQLALLEGRPGATVATQGRRGAIPAEGGVLARAGAPRFAFDPARPYAHPYFWAPFILMGNWR